MSDIFLWIEAELALVSLGLLALAAWHGNGPIALGSAGALLILWASHRLPEPDTAETAHDAPEAATAAHTGARGHLRIVRSAA